MFKDKLKKNIERIKERETLKDQELKDSLERTYLDDINNAIARGEFYQKMRSGEKEQVNHKDWVEADTEALKNAKEEDKEKLTNAMFENSKRSPEYLKSLIKDKEEIYNDLVNDPNTEFNNSYSAESFNKALEKNVPENLKKKYFQDEEKGDFYLKNSDSTIPSFKDEGNGRITTKNNSADTAKDIVQLAESRGWSKMKLSGTANFRRSAWLEASLKGIETIGYKANSKDLAELQSLKEQLRENFIEEVKEVEATATGNESTAPKTESTEATATENESTAPKIESAEATAPENKPNNSQIAEDFKNMDSEEFLKKYPEKLGTIQRKELALERIREDKNLTDEYKLIAEERLNEKIIEDLNSGKEHTKLEEIEIVEVESVKVEESENNKELEA